MKVLYCPTQYVPKLIWITLKIVIKTCNKCLKKKKQTKKHISSL